MNKHPRTDEREFAAIELKPSSRVVYASFARQLETELADARAEIERLNKRDGNAEIYLCAPIKDNPFNREKLSIADFGVADNHYIVESAEIERKDKLIEQMREALNVLVASATPSGPLWHGSAEMQIARAALSAAERGEG